MGSGIGHGGLHPMVAVGEHHFREGHGPEPMLGNLYPNIPVPMAEGVGALKYRRPLGLQVFRPIGIARVDHHHRGELQACGFQEMEVEPDTLGEGVFVGIQKVQPQPVKGQ